MENNLVFQVVVKAHNVMSHRTDAFFVDVG